MRIIDDIKKIDKKLIKKKKYTIYFFFAFVMTITAIISQIVPNFMLFSKRDTIDERMIKLKLDSESRNDSKFLWWSLDGGLMNLEVENNNIKSLKVYGIVIDGKSDEIVLKNNMSNIDMKYFGSFVATTEPFETDIDGDGVNEFVKVSSKIDTVFVQGIVTNASFFEKDKVKLDVSQIDFYTICVKYEGELLSNKDVKIVYSNNKEENILLDEKGTFKIKTLNTLKSGISIIYKDNKMYHITNYIIERNSLFSKSYLKGLYPIVFSLALGFDFILLIGVLRYNPFRKRIIIDEIDNTK